MPSKLEIVRALSDLPYSTRVYKDTCGGHVCFVAAHIELEGCMAQGETWEGALENLDIARWDYIETMIEEGWEVPPPMCPIVDFRWEAVAEYSGSVPKALDDASPSEVRMGGMSLVSA